MQWAPPCEHPVLGSVLAFGFLGGSEDIFNREFKGLGNLESTADGDVALVFFNTPEGVGFDTAAAAHFASVPILLFPKLFNAVWYRHSLSPRILVIHLTCQWVE